MQKHSYTHTRGSPDGFAICVDPWPSKRVSRESFETLSVRHARLLGLCSTAVPQHGNCVMKDAFGATSATSATCSPRGLEEWAFERGGAPGRPQGRIPEVQDARHVALPLIDLGPQRLKEQALFSTATGRDGQIEARAGSPGPPCHLPGCAWPRRPGSQAATRAERPRELFGSGSEPPRVS